MTRPPARPTGSRSWRPHAVLTAIALAQLGLWLARRPSDDELARRWTDGSPTERMAAAHVLLSRGAEPSAAARTALGPLAELGTRLLAEPDPLVRSLAFGADVCKLAPPIAQLEAVVAGVEDGAPRALREFVLQCRKVGGESVGATSAMKRAEVGWFLRAAALETWPPGEAAAVAEHLEPWLVQIRRYLEERR